MATRAHDDRQPLEGRRASAGAGRRTRRSLVAMALWVAGMLIAAAVLVAVDRAWVARRQSAASAGPEARVAGAVRSISGSESVRQTTYDATTRSASVRVISRYYDPGKSLAENKEYLATEGRMAAQLALYGGQDVQRVTIALYHRETLLATVTGQQGDAYDRMPIEYAGPLVGP